MIGLHRTARDDDAALAQVLAETVALLGPGARGFLSSPTEHHLVRLDTAVPTLPSGPIELAGVFAARAFGPDAELRWLRTDGGHGAAVVIAEHPVPLPGWTPTNPVEVLDTLEGRYALWGRRFAAHDTPGWCRASEGRLGRLDVPLPGPVPNAGDGPWPRQYLSLTYREYLSADAYGNAEVAEERLITIQTSSPTRGEVPA